MNLEEVLWEEQVTHEKHLYYLEHGVPIEVKDLIARLIQEEHDRRVLEIRRLFGKTGNEPL